MKRMNFFLSSVMLLCLTQKAWAQVPKQGLFFGGGATALQMNGTGQWGEENRDFEVTDDLVKFYRDYDGNYYGDSFMDGWSFNDKILLGFQPVVGLRLAPNFAVLGIYNYHFPKTGQWEETFTDGFDSVTLQSEVRYSQRAIQLLAQLGHPGFLLAGVEVVALELDIDLNFGELQGFEGRASASGFVVGAGMEVPSLSSQKMSFVLTALYSFTKYRGDELLYWKDYNTALDFELDIGGFSGSLGMRLYF